VPWNGIETRHGWQARATGKKNKQEEEQARATSKSNKPEEQARAKKPAH